MQYQISPSSSRSATYPHSWFILNLILVHLFAFLIILEIGSAMTILLIPLVSMVILALRQSARQGGPGSGTDARPD